MFALHRPKFRLEFGVVKEKELEYAQHRVGGPFEGLVEVAVVENDGRALAAKLQRDDFEVCFRGGLQNFAANQGASGERYFGNVHVLADGLADGCAWCERINARREKERRSRTVAVDEIEDTRGEAGFSDKFAKLEGRQRCHLRNLVAVGSVPFRSKEISTHLHHDSVACSQRWANFPRQHQHCERDEVNGARIMFNSLHTREVP